ALMRDNYRYILPRNVDKDSAINGLTVINMDVGERMRGTGPGHIFNELMTDHIVGLSDAAQRKLEWAFSAAAIVQRFAQISVVQELNRNNIHRAENTFTTTRDFHGLFDELSTKCCVWTSGPSDTQDATGGQIPLPSRCYFQLHNACANISHLSGAGEVVGQLFHDVEDIKVLAEDGGSQDLLSLALSSRL
ncbi:uncharacterized protein BT62DRAFT_838005, partial [Guyanagaster necrorhizus]